MNVTRAVVVTALLLIASAFAPAQITQLAELTASDGGTNDLFGIAVAVNGNIAVVGATGALAGNGAAYVFINSGGVWTQVAELTATDTSPATPLGASVAIEGSTIAVGAYVGNVYVFVEPPAGWSDTTQTAELSIPDYLGSGVRAVAISRDQTKVAVGVLNENDGLSEVFEEPSGGWSNMDQPTWWLDTSGYVFGVAITGDTVVASSSWGAFVYILPPNKANIFVHPVATLTAQGATSCFGSSVSLSISDDTIAVGDCEQSESGAVDIFVKPPAGWTTTIQTATLGAPTSAHISLGSAVSFFGGGVVAGAPFDPVNGDYGRGAFLGYTKPADGWVDTTQPNISRTSQDGAAADEFGRSIAISGTTILVGAPYHAINGNADQGAAYIFGPK